MATTKIDFLARLKNVHAFILANPGCGMKDICEGLGIKHTAVRYSIHSLEDSGHIETVVGKRSFKGQMPNAYTVIKDAAPSEVPETAAARQKRIEEDRVDTSVKRFIKPAKQIGMKPDPFALPASFFHPAAVSA